jgi:CheY-like chemotaxis protein
MAVRVLRQWVRPDEAAAAALGKGDGMTRIAVINTDPVYLDMMVHVLATYGEVHAYKETKGAFQALKQEQPDLIILDIRMETPDAGWNLLELLTLDAQLGTVPVIVCSAAIFDLRQHEVWLQEHGISILPKPFDAEHLFEKVEAALAPRPDRS